MIKTQNIAHLPISPAVAVLFDVVTLFLLQCSITVVSRKRNGLLYKEDLPKDITSDANMSSFIKSIWKMKIDSGSTNIMTIFELVLF